MAHPPEGLRGFPTQRHYGDCPQPHSCGHRDLGQDAEGAPTASPVWNNEKQWQTSFLKTKSSQSGYHPSHISVLLSSVPCRCLHHHFCYCAALEGNPMGGCPFFQTFWCIPFGLDFLGSSGLPSTWFNHLIWAGVTTFHSFSCVRHHASTVSSALVGIFIFSALLSATCLVAVLWRKWPGEGWGAPAVGTSCWRVWCQDLPAGEEKAKWCTFGGALTFLPETRLPSDDVPNKE